MAVIFLGVHRAEFGRKAEFSRPLMEVVAGFTSAGAVLSTVLPAVVATVVAASGVDQFVDLGAAFVFGRGHHRNREFSLRAVASFHDLTDPQAAVLSWNVRLLTIS